MHINEILKYISQNSIYGIPLDIIAHFTLGGIITIALLKFKNYFFRAYLIILGLELIKEYYDSFTLQSTMKEHLKDTIITMIFPTLLLMIRLYNKKTTRNRGYYR